MNKALVICLCVVMLLGGGIIGLKSFSSKAQASGSGIIIEDADYVSANTTEYSADLTNVAKNVTPRVIVEYGDSIFKLDLYKSDDLNQAASMVTSRMIVEYAASILEYNLQNVTVPDITPRIIVEYADSIFELGLQGSQNLIQVANTVTPRIIVEYADLVSSTDLERPSFPETWGLKLFLSDPSTFATYGDNVRISTRLTDEKGSPISNANITFQISGKPIGSNITDKDGYSEITYAVDLLPGTYDLGVSYTYSTIYSPISYTGKLVIEKEITKLSDPSTNVLFNKVTIIRVRLTDDEGYPLAGANITFWIYLNDSWSPLGWSITNGSGYAEISFLANQLPNTYKLKANYDGNEFYRSSERHGTLFIFSRVIIDRSLVTKERANVGSTQRIFFHAIWEHNSSSIKGGLLSVNGTRYVTNATGWIEIDVTWSGVGLKTWTITAVDCHGANVFSQIAENPRIIWDRIGITYSLLNTAPGAVRLIVSLQYSYDNMPVNDAEVLIGGVKAVNNGDGTYAHTMSSWLPYLSVDAKIDRSGFDIINIGIQGLLLVNLITLISGVFTTFLVWKGYKKRCRWNALRERDRLLAEFHMAILKGEELLLQDLQKHKEPELRDKFRKIGLEWSPLIDTVHKDIALTYLSSIRDTISLSDFAERFKISEQEAKNLLSYSLKLTLINGYFIKDGKEFITTEELRKRIRKQIE